MDDETNKLTVDEPRDEVTGNDSQQKTGDALQDHTRDDLIEPAKLPTDVPAAPQDKQPDSGLVAPDRDEVIEVGVTAQKPGAEIFNTANNEDNFGLHRLEAGNRLHVYRTLVQTKSQAWFEIVEGEYDGKFIKFEDVKSPYSQ